MPGLPKNLQTTYQKYKNHTDFVAQWLASTARKNGYSPAKAKEKNKSTTAPHGRPTYTVATKEWIDLAEYLAALTPAITVPVKLSNVLDVTIRLRQSFIDDVSDILQDTAEKRSSDDRHVFFLGILRKVREILAPILPKDRGTAPPAKAKTTEQLINMFDHLDLEEPSSTFEQAPDITPSIVEPVYKAERSNTKEEAFFAFHLLLHDLNELRSEVCKAWLGYRDNACDLIAASLTTNTAVDLARSMIEELKSTFASHGTPQEMLKKFYEAQCVQARKSLATADDDEMFELGAIIYWPSCQLLTTFCKVLAVNPTPEANRGVFGTYDPASDRNSKSPLAQANEDKILLFEMLAEFFYYCRATEPTQYRPPVEDELIRALRDMFKTKEVTLPLVFATTLFLDIHHIMRANVGIGYKHLASAVNFVCGDVKEEVEFHRGIDMPTWPQENDEAVQQFLTITSHWCLKDLQLDVARRLKRINIPKPFQLYKNHPWLCGLWKYMAQMRFHEISIAFVNAWGSIMSCSHLYNAVGGGSKPPYFWKDLEIVLTTQSVETFFLADDTATPDDNLKRFALAMGASATNLAKSTRRKKGLTLSKRGPKGLKEMGPGLQTLKGRYCDGNGQTDLRKDDVEKILEQASWDYDLTKEGRVGEIYKDFVKDAGKVARRATIKHLPVTKLLGILRDVLQAEVMEIQYDYLRLHRQCWRLLRIVKDKCRDDLLRTYGPNYMEKESELPFITGYVLMSASRSQDIGELLKARLPGVEATDKLLAYAKHAVEGLVESGAGGLIIERILPMGLGVHIDIEFELDKGGV